MQQSPDVTDACEQTSSSPARQANSTEPHPQPGHLQVCHNVATFYPPRVTAMLPGPLNTKALNRRDSGCPLD